MNIPSCPPTYTCSWNMHPPDVPTDLTPLGIFVVSLIVITFASMIVWHWLDVRKGNR